MVTLQMAQLQIIRKKKDYSKRPHLLRESVKESAATSSAENSVGGIGQIFLIIIFLRY